MQELKNIIMLVLMWVKCQHSKPNNHRNLPIHLFNEGTIRKKNHKDNNEQDIVVDLKPPNDRMSPR